MRHDIRLINRKGVRVDSNFSDDLLHATNVILDLSLGHANEKKLKRFFENCSLTNVAKKLNRNSSDINLRGVQNGVVKIM